MKKIIISMVLLFTFSLLLASGLFNLDYGMDPEQVVSALQKNGFKYSHTSPDNTKFYFVDPSNIYVNCIGVEFNTYKRLKSWYVEYSASNTQEIDSIVIDTLDSLYGEHIFDGTYFYWDLFDNKFCMAGYSDSNCLMVMYDITK